MGTSNQTTSPTPLPVAGPNRHRWAIWMAAGMGCYALAIGILSFAGWIFDVRRLTAWGGGISIQPNTALAAMAAGCGLVLLTRGHRRAVVPFAIVCALIGLATLAEHVTGVDLGIDTLFTFGRPWGGTATVAPGRMGPPASTSWSLLGLSLLAALGDRRGRQVAGAMALATLAIGALSFIGYLLGANPLYAIAPLTAIALPASTVIVAVALGVLSALGDTQPMQTLLEPSGAGVLARRALPFVIVVPLVLGVLRLRGQQAGWYDTGMGTALLVLAIIVVMSAVLWWCVGAVSAHERALEAATRTVRENEGRFRRLADAIPQIVWVLDADGGVTFINQQWRDYTGWADAAVGDPSFGVHPDDLAELREGWEGARRAKAEYTAEFRLRAVSDGGYRWHLCRVVPIRDEGGRVVQWYGTSTDIHDRRHAEEQLRQSAKMEAIGRLAGGVAHDFNNQLSAVSGFASFAARDPGLGARARHDLQEVLKATERMAGLTRQLLAFSRQQVLQPEILQLNAAVLDGSSLLQRLIGSHIEFRLELTADDTWIRVDRAQLLQVLMNLAINARDAMSEGGVLHIRTGRLEVTGREPRSRFSEPLQSGAYVLLSVSDDGAGIQPEHLSHIFEPFFTTKEQGQGTGLGLATVHGIVTQSQGHIAVESRPGEGSKFTVLFPAVPAPVAAADVAEEIPDPARRAARILVVEDEDAVRSILSRTLEAEGYEVSQARNGQEALDRLAAIRDVAAVLTDVVMPKLGGRELVERLAADYPGLPVIWMSGYPRDIAFGDGGPARTSAFLQKPIPPDVLIRPSKTSCPGGRRATGEGGPADVRQAQEETTMRLVDPIIAEFEQEAQSTQRVLERIPEERLGWRPHPRSMSLGQLALHIATTPGGVARIAAQDGVERPQFDRPEPTSKREVLEALQQSVSAAVEFLRGLDDARATQTWTMTRGQKPVFTMPRIGVVRTIMLNHWYHHRGEMQVYLRLLDVPVPSVYGPSADEDPFGG